MDRPTDKVQVILNVQCMRSTASKVVDILEGILKLSEVIQTDDFYHVDCEEIDCEVLRVDTDGSPLYKE